MNEQLSIPQDSELSSEPLIRARRLYEELKDEVEQCRRSSGRMRLVHTLLFWLSVAFGLGASFWGVVGPAFVDRPISPAEVSGLAAIATGLQIALRQARLHERSDWYQRKADKLRQYLRRMRYCFDNDVAQKEIEEIVQGCNELDDRMTSELLQFASDSAGIRGSGRRRR